MRTNINPFSDNKREGEGNSEIFLNYNDATKWYSNSNYLFEGHRGSGKTTILSAFNYKYVWHKESRIKPSDSLKKYYEGKPKFLGVIYKCENQDKDTWDNWAKNYNETDAEFIYTTYLNYFFAEKFVEAIEEIQKNSKYEDPNDSEYLFFKKALEIGFPLNKLRPKTYDYSLHTLKVIFADIHNAIRHEIINGASPNHLKTNFCLHDNCDLIYKICCLIETSFVHFRDILYFALVDDVNRLADWQIRCINTMLICYQNPLSFKLSSVSGLYHTKESRDETRPIGNSDLNIVFLGYDKDPTKISKQKDIDDLLQAVFNSRIKKIYPDVNEIDLETLFGKEPDLNEQLLNVLNKCEKKVVSKLLLEFERSEYKNFTDFWIDKNEIRPVVEDSEIDKKFFDKKRNSEVYNKFRQTATFSIINHYSLGSGFEYSSLDIIKHLICGSVRRFLKICEYLWPDIQSKIESKGEITRISNSLQSKAIKQCADHVYLGIDNRNLRANVDISCRKICDRLSELFLLFISPESLKITTECLSLKVAKKDLDKDLTDFIDSIVLFEAFIKIDKGDHFMIGLHPILAPKFCIPYRSPFYYSQNVSGHILRSIIENSDKDYKQVKDTIFNNRINKRDIIDLPIQGTLFETEIRNKKSKPTTKKVKQ